MTELTTTEAAQIIGCDPHHVCYLCRRGKLACRRVGKMLWLIDAESAKHYADHRPAVGNPAFGPGFWTGRKRGKRKK